MLSRRSLTIFLILFFLPTLSQAGEAEKVLYRRGSQQWVTGKSAKPVWAPTLQPTLCEQQYGKMGKMWVTNQNEHYTCHLRYQQSAGGKYDDAAKQLQKENKALPPTAKRSLSELTSELTKIVWSDSNFGKCPTDMQIHYKQSAKIAWSKEPLQVAVEWECTSSEMNITQLCGKDAIFNGIERKCKQATCEPGYQFSAELNLCYQCSSGVLDAKETKVWSYEDKRQANCEKCVLCSKP